MIYIITIGAFQALMAILLLWKRKLNDKADSLLLVLLTCIATHLLIKFYIFTIVSDMHVRTQMNTFIGFCYGPLAYMYVKKRKDEQYIPALHWQHFIPFLVAAVAYLAVACLLYVYTPAGHKALDLYNQSSTWLFIASGIIYAALVLNMRRSLPAGADRGLVTHMAISLMAIGIVSTLFYLFDFIWGSPPDAMIWCRNIVYTLLSFICIDILRYRYTGIAAVPAHAPESEAPLVAPAAPATSVRKTQLSAEEQQQVWQKLEDHIRKTALYTDADLNLDKLAEAVQVNKYYVSETLNAYAHKSFYQYINEYRILRAAAMMKSIQEKGLPVNILMVAYDCGFKAKSSFNTYFKKIIGETPSVWLLKQKHEQPTFS
ncbi:AraC family transcriptional regulator [Chitinophaga sp. G-6-1-13]|uniref:AraC family transcriptional regulator n=1 Tax=Chitinophaga fulva TaxID=2728842 RepID=A0A848GR11_9BACT|nr:helix-turn-helix domain-containing protein [Chitinophaga fulva]NML39799.1 AraC family transcriptional regulator [Chitinophaga fulva]